MEVQHKKRENKGMFYVQEDGEILARMTYMQPDREKLVVEHTEVDDEIRHENVGYQMVHTAVQYARNHHLKIVPMCPFVKAVFDKKPEYKDVWLDTYE
jgi:uncharacterized protein